LNNKETKKRKSHDQFPRKKHHHRWRAYRNAVAFGRIAPGFKRWQRYGLPENQNGNIPQGNGVAVCAVRLLEAFGTNGKVAGTLRQKTMTLTEQANWERLLAAMKAEQAAEPNLMLKIEMEAKTADVEEVYVFMKRNEGITPG
jgi:hypothetical protein